MTTTAEPGTSLAPYEAAAAPALRVPALPDLPDVDSWIRAMASIAKLADKICDTDFVPAAMRGKPDAVTAAILTGRELGLPPMLALRTINMIKGTPSLSAEYMRSKVLSLGHEFRIDEWDNDHCVIYARRKGAPAGREFSYFISEARKAGLIRKNRDGSPGKYETDPMAMMLARATTRACKAMFGDVINGLATTELLGDADVMAEITGAALELPAAPKPPVADLKARAAAYTVTAKVVTPEPPSAAPEPPVSGPAAHTPAEVAAAGGDLPPLPGEEDAPGPATPPSGPGAPNDLDYDTPGTVTNRQLTAIWTSLSQTYHFGGDEKDAARGVCADILSGKGKRVELASSKNLSHNQARTVLDTLAHWKAQAEKQDEDPRGYLMLMLEEARKAREARGGDGQAGDE